MGYTMEHVMQIEFPLWIRIVAYIFYAGFIIWIIRGVYRNYLSAIISKRRIVEAKLISKVEEPYSEIKVYNNKTAGQGNNLYSKGGLTRKTGMAYRLYFNVNGKYIELDADKKTFDMYEEGQEGAFDYKGCMFYSFEKK